MNIKILGTGCAKCNQLEENAKKAIAQSGSDHEIEKVTELNKIMDYGVMMTPALVINEKVISSGKILSADDIAALLN
ncbi:MAG: TM0996/MTH895 family glutaredoxin-like protein [Spirochaetes bacterium]|nr:TM0996/MTH895 family glutaredoxin-like protein [Spirochaetota bacterium]